MRLCSRARVTKSRSEAFIRQSPDAKGYADRPPRRVGNPARNSLNGAGCGNRKRVSREPLSVNENGSRCGVLVRLGNSYGWASNGPIGSLRALRSDSNRAEEGRPG